MEDMGQHIDIHLIHQSAVYHQTVLAYPLGKSGHFLPFHQNVVSSGECGGHSQGLQGFHQDTGIFGIIPFEVFRTPHNGIVQIAQVVIDSSPTGDSPHQVDVVGFQIVQVDLRIHFLVEAYNDGGPVSPKKEDRFVYRKALEAIFIECHVVIRVIFRILDVSHTLFFIVKGKVIT